MDINCPLIKLGAFPKNWKLEFKSIYFFLLFSIFFSESAEGQPFYPVNWDQILFEDNFETDREWMKFEEIIDSACYVADAGEVTRTLAFSNSGAYSLEVGANQGNSQNSNHLIGARQIFDEGITGICTYIVYSYIPEGPGQTGPEFSVQNTKDLMGTDSTYTAGIQYISNPWMGNGGQWNIWDQAAWQPFLSKPLEEGCWYRFELEFTYSEIENPYRQLIIEKLGAEADTIDLSSFTIKGEDKGFEPALWITLESENLWTDCMERTQYSVFYDDIQLRCRTDNPVPCSAQIGTLIDPMDDLEGWEVRKGNGGISGTLALEHGIEGRAIQLTYDLGGQRNAWVQLLKTFDRPIALTESDHLRFFYRGSDQNALEVGIITEEDQIYFAPRINDVTHISRFTYFTFDLRDFRKNSVSLSRHARIKSIFLSVTFKDEGVGGNGKLLVDEIQLLKLGERTVPENFEMISIDRQTADQAAAWIAEQLQPGDLLRSWREESSLGIYNAWLYDQAIGLIVLSETDLAKAGRLAEKLIALQSEEGCWYAGYDYRSGAPVSQNKPIGAISWTIYALTRFSFYADDQNAWEAAQKGAAWLATQQRNNGSLPAEPDQPGAPTEPNLDAWWAFHATDFKQQADRLRDFLLGKTWDTEMGRFKADTSSYQIFLDNQTWGACFLRAIGRDEDAKRALSYARHNLVTHHTFVPEACGLDGAGPFGVWNEGTLQYVVAGGENSSFYMNQMVRQQSDEGSLPGSPANFRGYIVWLTSWYGIAPTSWLYFAANGGPFVSELKTAVAGQQPESLTTRSVTTFPNPFDEKTKIRFQLARKNRVRLTVYNGFGQPVASLLNDFLASGDHTVEWDGRDDKGIFLPGGMYYFVIWSGNSRRAGKMILVKGKR